MAKAFNLTAQINLQGPANIKPVVAKIRRELGTISTNLDIKFDSKVAKNVQNLTGKLSGLNVTLAETNRNSKDLIATLSSLSSAFNSLGSASKAVSGIDKSTSSVNATAKAVKQASSEMAEFGKQSALAIRRFAAFSVVTSGVFALINAITSGTRAFIAFDQEIIKLRQTTGAGAISIKELENEITNLAVNLGVSSEKLAGVAIVLAQAGLSAKETRIALAALAKTELAPSFENIEQTTEGAIAALRQFDIEVVDLEKALGSINAVAAAFAVESSDIVAAIQRAGGAFAASSKGVSEGIDALNEFIAVFTSVRATTRESAETIATGLRTIFTRIQRGSTIKFLKEFGVELTDAEGKFIGTFNAVQRLSEVLNTLDPRDLRFAQIVEELGGFRQIGKVIPLVQEFATAQKALGVAQRGQSSLAENQVTAQLALANQLARVREEFLALVRAIGQSQTFQVLFKTILGITSGLIKLASVFKPILPLLTILAGIKGFGALTQFAGGFAGGIRKSATGTSNIGENIGSVVGGDTDKTRSEATERATSAISNNTDSLKSLTSAVQALTQAINTKLGSGGTTLNSGGKVLAFARGGSVPGRGRGDKIPALLEPQEYVLNRKAVRSIGKRKLDLMNKKYLRGGPVEEELQNIRSRQFNFTDSINPTDVAFTDIVPVPVSLNSSDFDRMDEIIKNQILQNEKILEQYGTGFNRLESIEILKRRKRNPRDPSTPEDFLKLKTADWLPGYAFQRVLEEKFPTKVSSIKPENFGTSRQSFKDIIEEHFAPLDFESGDAKFSYDGAIRYDRPDEKLQILRKRFANEYASNRLNPSPTPDFEKFILPPTQIWFPEEGLKERYERYSSLSSLSQIMSASRRLGESPVGFFAAGGKIQKFSDGGISKFKGRGTSRPRGARDIIDPISTETYLKWAKNIYDEYDADPSLVMTKDDLGIRMPPEIALANRLLTQYALETGGAGLSVGSRFVITPQDRISDEIKPFLVPNPTNSSQYGFFEDVVLPFMKAKTQSIAQTTKLGKERALANRQSELSAYTNAEAAISQFKTTGQLELDPKILNYVRSSMANPDSLPLEPKKLAKLKSKLTKTNIDAFENLVNNGVPVSVQGQRTALSEAFNSILDTYGSDVGMLELDNIVQSMGRKLNLGGAVESFNAGGLIRNFRFGGIQEPITKEEAEKLAAQTIVGGIGGSSKADQILSQYWDTNIPSDPKKPKKQTKKPKAKDVLNTTKIKEWVSKYSESESGKRFLSQINSAREALYTAYVDQVNKNRTGSAPLNTQQIGEAQQTGLLFGVAGMYGNAFAPRELKLVPGITGSKAINQLKGPVDVSLVGAVLPKDEIEKQARLNAQIQSPSDKLLDIQLAPTRDELSDRFGEKASLYAIKNANKQRAISYVDAIARALDPSSGGSQIFLDFDKTLAFGADKLTRFTSSGSPDYSAFSDRDEVAKGLSTAKLSNLGSRLKELVKESNQKEAGLGSELLKRMFVVTARPDDTTDLIAQWLQNQDLNIPSGNFVGVGGPGRSPNDVAVAKAEAILSRITGDKSIFIDDDLRNVDVARTRGIRATQYGSNIDKKARKDAQDREGTYFEKFVRENLPPDLVRAMTSSQRGESIDYPRGLGDLATTWFDQPLLANIPTDVKRTVSGVGKVKDNIANYLRKTLNFMSGGRAYARGGFVNALLTPGEAVIDPNTAKRIGYAKLDKMNYADKNNFGRYARGGGVSIVPGTGNTDSYGPVPLPVGSYVIRKKATQALGFNKGGSVGTIQKFAGGRRVGVIAEDRRLAELFKQLAASIRGGMTSSDAFDRVVESARTDFPEAANLLRDAAEAFRSGADPAAVFAPFGGELARLAADSFSSFALEADAFADLAKIVTKAADTMDLFAIEASDAGSSLETFESNLKKRLQEQVLGREAQRRSSRIDLGRQVIRSRSTDITDPTAVTDAIDQLRGPLTDLIGGLTGVDPADIDNTLQAIVSGSAAGESLQELRDRLPLLNQAFDNTIDRTAALAAIESEAVSALGGLTASVRSTIEELDALDYKKSGLARQEFGAVGEAFPEGALRIKRSAIGGALLNTAKSFQTDLGLGGVPVVGKALGGLNNVLRQLPGPIGNAVRAIGGLPGALAAAASIIGSEFIPQLNKLAGVAENPFFAGIAGGVASGGSFAVSLGTIGQQIGGEIGGLVGTIGGAIVGVFRGFTDAFRQQELTNALKGLTSATDKAKIALDNLSKYDSAENAQAVQKAAVETEAASRKLEELAQRTTTEAAVDTGIFAGAGTVIGSIIVAGLSTALAPFSLGLSALAGALIIGGGTIAGGAYGATKGPSELDDEALNSFLNSLVSINEAFTTLAARDIKFKSLEDLNKIIDGFRDSSGAIDTESLGRQSEYIRQAQEGALRAAGFTISSTESLESQLRSLGSGAQQLAEATAAQFAYQAGLEELNRQLGGNLVAVRAATDTEEERQAITRRGFERIGEERRQLALQQRLATIARQVSIETENLVDVYNRLLSAVQRYNDTLNQTDSAIANATDILLNQRNLNRSSRSDQSVLQNARAYSVDELEKVLRRVADLAGGGERGQQLTDAVRGRRVVEDQLPQILRNVTQRNIGDVSTSIIDLFEKAGIGREVSNALVEEIEQTLESETGGRQGKSFDELAQQFSSLQKAMDTMEKANESAIALLEAQSNLYDKVIDRLNAYSDAIQKSTEWTLRAADIRIQSENDLAKALGRNISLENLNRAFNQQIEILTRDLAGGLQGTTNPSEIAARIRANQKALEDNQRAIREQPSTPQGRQTVGDLLKQQEKLKTSSANLYQALEKLATSGDNASNALNKLQERRQISENATDLLERVFTQGAEEADKMFRSFGALRDALSGRLMFGNQNERVLAFEGLRTLLPLLGNEIGNQLRAALLENMLKGNNISLQDELIPGIGGQGRFTFEDILNNLRNPEADPATKALIDSYETATSVMIRAAEEISRLNSEAATKFSEAASSLINIPFPTLQDQANAGPLNQVAVDLRKLTTEATNPGSIYTHDIKSEELLRSISQNLSGRLDDGPIIGANNLNNINLPVFEKISIAIPNLTTELLNVIKTLESLNISISDLTQTLSNNLTDVNRSPNRTTSSVENFNINIEAFSSATKEFGGYINRLERIKFPEKITMGGSYTLDVRVSGAAAFQSLEEKTRNIIDAEISREIAQLEERIAKSTGYSVDPRRREP